MLLAIHGGPSWDHSYLLPAVAELADVRHVVLFDLRGCGRSSRDLPLEAYQPERCIDDLHLLIRWLGVEQVDLLGFSYGGQLAMLFLERHTAQVGRLILASTTAYPGIEQYLRESPEYRRRYAGIDLEPLFADPSLDDEEKTRRMAMLTAPLMLWDLDRLDE
ncbi:MAG: hypothetical protein QOD41_3462, partial [Cryptosporangiaceae bacterium]|nr:hypothetical protein [Cryptosporangiaceae bacterium]